MTDMCPQQMTRELPLFFIVNTLAYLLNVVHVPGKI